jgi:hypothetical protein
MAILATFAAPGVANPSARRTKCASIRARDAAPRPCLDALGDTCRAYVPMHTDSFANFGEIQRSIVVRRHKVLKPGQDGQVALPTSFRPHCPRSRT